MTGCHSNCQFHCFYICACTAGHIYIHHTNIAFHYDLLVFRQIRNQRAEGEHTPVHHQFTDLDHRRQLRIKKIVQTHKVVQKIQHIFLEKDQFPDFLAVGKVGADCHIVFNQFPHSGINILFRIRTQHITVESVKYTGIFFGGPRSIGSEFCFQRIPGIHIQLCCCVSFCGIQSVKESIDLIPPQRIQCIRAAHQLRSLRRIGDRGFFQKSTDRFRCQRVICKCIACSAGNIPEPEGGGTAEERIGLFRNRCHCREESAGLLAIRKHFFRCGIILRGPGKIAGRQLFKVIQQIFIDPVHARKIFLAPGEFHDITDAIGGKGIILFHRSGRDHTVAILQSCGNDLFMIADLTERNLLCIGAAEIGKRHFDRVVHRFAFRRFQIQIIKTDRITFPFKTGKIFLTGKNPFQCGFHFIAAYPVVLIRIHSGKKIFVADEGIGLCSDHCPMRHIHIGDHAQIFAFGDQHLSGAADQTERYTLFFCFTHINSLSVFRRIAPHLILSETPHSAPAAAHRSYRLPTGSEELQARWSGQEDVPA